MNKVFKTIWNEQTETWIPVAEITKAHRSGGKSAKTVARGFVAAAALTLAVSTTVFAADWNGSVDNNWGTAGNWSNGAPAAGTTVTIVDTDTGIDGKTITISGVNALGNLTVGTSNTSPSSLTLSGGTLNFDNSGSLSTLSLQNNRSLTINSAITTANDLNIQNNSAYGTKLTLGSTINGGGNNLSFDTVANAQLLANGIISNTANITKSGAGSLTLGNANTFAGTFNFNAGTIVVGNNASFGTATINMADNGNQLFDISSGSRTFSNQVNLNNGFGITGVAKTLMFNATQTNTLTGETSINTDNSSTLELGSNFALAGAGSINKTGYGTLQLDAKNSTLSGGIKVSQGVLQTGSFTDTLVIGSATGTNHILGTGDINLTDSTSQLLINGTSASTVQFAGGTTTIASGSKLSVKNGGATDFAGGTIDFGTAATKGSLDLNGNVTLGNTTFTNANGASMTIAKDLTINTGSTLSNSGIDITLNPTANQNLTATGLVSITGNLTKTGAGKITLSPSITGLSVKSLNANAGILDLGTATVTLSSNQLNANGGTLQLNKADQLNPTSIINLTGTSSVFNLNGFNQTYAGLNGLAGSGATFNLGGISTTSNTLTLGALGNNALGIRISDWDGTLASSFDKIYLTADPGASSLANVWFQGYGKGATVTNVAGKWELTPTANLDSEWNGGALAGTNMWGDGGNWVGGDLYNVPDHAGAIARFGDLAGSLANKTVNLGGLNRTIGKLIVNSSTTPGGTNITFSNGSIIFDSGDAATSAAIEVLSAAPGTSFIGVVQIKSNLDITSKNSMFFYVGMSGAGAITLNSGSLYVSGNSTNYSGKIVVKGGILYNNYNSPTIVSNSLGTGTLRIEGGTVSNYVFSNTKMGLLSNTLEIAGSFTGDYNRFTQVGDVTLGGIYNITANSDGSYIGSRSSLIFDTGLNLVGAGGFNKYGVGTMEILSPNSTFSGGLGVNLGTLYSSLTSDLVIGALSAGNNYLGSGNITVDGANSALSVDSNNKTGTMSGSTLTTKNAGQFRYLGGGSFNLNGGTLDGGATGSKGTLLVAGDLSFNGTTLINTPNITVDTTSNTTGNTTVYGNGVVDGIGYFSKLGSGITTLDSTITSLGAVNVYVKSGVLQMSRDNQIASTAQIILSGGALSSGGNTASLGKLFLWADSSLMVGNSGGLTFSSRGSNPLTDWYDGKILTLQNGGQDWNLLSSAYVRFATDPVFTAKELGNIAFTGYESGAKLSTTQYSGYWTLLPSATTTNEWTGAGTDHLLWNTAGNWLSNSAPNAFGASATIRDLDQNLDGKTIDVNGNYTVGRLNIESSSGQQLTIGGSGTLTIDGAAGQTQIKQAGVNTTTFAANTILNGTTNLITSVNPAVGYLDWTGTVSGTGGFTKTGAGTLRLSGGTTNSYAGGFSWQDPSLIQVNTNGSLFGSGDLTIGTGVASNVYKLETTGGSHTVSNNYTLAGSLTLQKDTVNNVTIATPVGVNNRLTFSGAGTLATGVNVISVYGNNGSTTALTEVVKLALDGTLSGGGGIQKNGNGDLYINGINNSFAGGFALYSGRVYFANDQAFGTGTLSLINNTTAAYIASLNATGGSAAAPLLLSNKLALNGSAYYIGNIKFDYSGTSTMTGNVGIGQPNQSDLMIIGKNHVLSGTGTLLRGVVNSWGVNGTLRLEGANTYSGGSDLWQGPVQVGVDSVKDAGGTLVSGALGTGTVKWMSRLSAYSDTGSGILSRRLSNAFNLSPYNSSAFGASGDAKTLILDTPTITLRDAGKVDWTLTGDAGSTLSIESQLVDNGTKAGGITLGGSGTLELKNGNNQISDGMRISSGTLLATATGDVTTGRLDADKNQFGSGRLILDGGTTRIATTDGSTVLLSGSGMDMNNAGNLVVSGGTAIKTIFDSDSTFTGTATTGSITTSGQLIKETAGTTTTVGAKLVTPELVITSGTLNLANANIVSGVNKLTMNGGTLGTSGLNQSFTNTQLVLNADSHIDFGSGSSTVTMGSLQLTADGKYVSNTSYTLSLDNWTGNSSAGGGTDRFIVSNGVVAGQKLYNVWFTGGYAVGGKFVNAFDSKLELIPLGKAFIWDNHTGSALWTGNWTDPGTPGAGDAAVFMDLDTGLNGRTISTGSGTTLGNISFESTNNQAFKIAGGTITLDTGDINQAAQLRTVGNSSPTINTNINLKSDLLITANSSGTLSLNGAISGAGDSITKNGTGTIALGAGSASSNYTGGLTINDGTVQIGASSTLDGLSGVQSGPAGIGVLTINGGTLEATGGNQTLNNETLIAGDFTIAGTNSLTLAGNGNTPNKKGTTITSDSTITVSDASGILTFGTDIPLSGTKNITKAGAGTLNFNSNGSGYSGNVTAAGGTIGIGTSNGFGSGALTLNDGTTLSANANNLTIANTVTLGSGIETISTSANDLTLSGAISGSGAISKTGTGDLKLVNTNNYSGGTDITSGSVTLTNANGAGSGTIAIGNGGTLNANFSTGNLANALIGSGTTNINGTNIAITGNNSSFSGTLDITSSGSAQITTANNLGGSNVTLDGILSVNPSVGNFSFTNKLSGSGTLNTAMTNASDVFSFSSSSSNGFTGTASIGQGIVSIDAGSSAALSAATLKLDTNSKAQINGTTNSVGNLTINGGTILSSTNATTGKLNEKLTTGTLALTSGNVELDLAPMGTSAGILMSDDGITSQLIAATTITGNVSNIKLVDTTGTALGTSSIQNITQGANTVAKATYDNSLTTDASGLNVNYQLTQLDLQTGQTLALNSAAATGSASELKAKVIGSGSLDLSSGTSAGNSLTISNSGNNYTGSTTISAGTVKAGVADVFKNTGNMIISTGATLDLNNLTQQVNNLQGSGNVTASAALTANNTASSTFAGVISGTGTLTKTGTSTLTLSGANTYTGATTVNSGTLKLTNKDGASNGAITTANNATLDLNFSGTAPTTPAIFNNNITDNGTITVTGNNIALNGTISGAGTAAISGSNINIAGNNTLSGLFDITGSAAVTKTTNLGSAEVKLNGTGSTLAVAPTSGNFALSNKLSGSGTLTTKLANATDTFDLTNSGNAFTGTLNMGTGTFNLSGNNTTTLANATLKTDTGSKTIVGTGNQNIGTLTTGAGEIQFNAKVPSDTQASGMIIAKNLDLNGTGNIKINLPGAPGMPNVPNQINSTNLLSQDDNGALTKLAGLSGGTLTGAGGALKLVDQNGNAISNGQQIDISEGGSKVATGTYDYRLNTSAANDGLYVSYALKQVDITAGKTLTLTPDTSATGLDTDLSAQVTGTGNLTASAGAGKTVSLTNTTNSYSGTTTVATGTLKLGSNSALGNTSQLTIESAATTDINGFQQTIGSLDGKSNSTLALNNGGLTITNGGTSNGTLTGTGSMTIAGGNMTVNGANNALTAGVTINNGATTTLNNVAGLGTSGTITDNGTLILNSASGNLSKTVGGTGAVNLTNSSNVTLTGSNTLTGSWNTTTGTTLTAATQANLGNTSANVINNGSFIINSAATGTIGNQLTGSGNLVKQGIGNTTLTNAQTQGSVNVTAGTLTINQSGAFNVTTGNYTTATGATTDIGRNGSTLNITNGEFKQAASDSTLTVALSGVNNTPAIITATNATLNGTLNVTGFTNAALNSSDMLTASTVGNKQYHIVKSDNAIQGDFNNVNIAPAVTGIPEYLLVSGHKTTDNKGYDVGLELAWNVTDAAKRIGEFNTANSSDTFNADITLADQTVSGLAPNANWNGTDLLKTGAGTLILSKVNSYSGSTTINGGTLQTGIADAFKTSSNINVATGGKLDLNNFNQTANNLTGNGNITLGTATLTANNATATDNTNFGGVISDSGNLIKTGDGTLTLTGANTYTGSTTINTGTLQVGNGTSGSLVSNITNNATLAFNNSSYTGKLSGSGDMKQIGGTTTLSGNGSSQGSIDVTTGTLKLAQTDTLNIETDYTTRTGATTDVGTNGSTLNVAGKFTQESGSTLNVALSAINNNPAAIKADIVQLDGGLNITGFSATNALDATSMKSASTLGDNQYHVIESNSAIQGDFAPISIAPAPPTVADYLLVSGHKTANDTNYDVGLELAWTANDPSKRTGSFTMADGTGFNVDVALADQTSANPLWDGTTLTKNGAGSLVLSKTNSYTGSTTINGGTLALVGEGDISTSSNVVSDGTLDITGITAAGTTINNLSGAATGLIKTAAKILTVNSTTDTTYAGNFDATNGLIKTGDKELVLTGQTLYTGDTQLNQGTLTISGTTLTSNIIGQSGTNLWLTNSATLTGWIDPTNVTVDAGSSWNMTANSIVDAMNIAGVINFSDLTNGGQSAMTAGRTLTATEWNGTSGTVNMYTVLGGDNSTTDKLIINKAYSGTTYLDITNAGGTGAKTAKGIELIQADSATATSGKFILANKLTVGGYSYKLQQGSGDNDPAFANDWFLVSSLESGLARPTEPTIYVPEHSIYSSLYNQAISYSEASIGTLHDRMGGIDEISNNKDNIAWGRIIGQGVRDNGAKNGIYGHEIKTQTDTAAIQVGSDLWVNATPTHARTSVGLFGTYGHSRNWSFNSDATSSRAGYNDMDAYSLGAYLTHLGGNGGYIDLVLQGSRYNITSKDAKDQKLSSTNGFGVAASLEAGKRFAISKAGTTIEPQAQAVFQINQFDSTNFMQQYLKTNVRFDRSNDVLLRGSVRLASSWETNTKEAFTAWITPGVYYNTGNKAKTSFTNSQDSITAQNDLPGLRAGAVAGIDGQISKNIQLNAKIGGDTSIDKGNMYSYTGQIGLKVSF